MVGNFGSSEQILWPVSFISGIFMCKIVYEITGLISREFFKGYHRLSKPTKIEWKNRGFSTFHAILVAAISFYLLVLSDLFKERTAVGSIIDRKSLLSDSLCGISVGYFLTDLGMILWYFPALGGVEYVLHHVISMYAIVLSLISGQAQYYILMVLFSEITTPFVNLRWYLDAYGQKSSMLYICNGVALFLGWLAARILLFIFFFAHMYLHFDQVSFENCLSFAYSTVCRTLLPQVLYSCLQLCFRRNRILVHKLLQETLIHVSEVQNTWSLEGPEKGC